MKRARIIPRLDIKGSNLVKGIHLEGLRVLGDPEKFATEYYNNGADEIMYQDVVASLYQRNSLLDQISKICDRCIIFEKGKIIHEDSTLEAIEYYKKYLGLNE